MKQVTVYIEDEQHNWLKEHPQINLSGFIRKQLEKLIEKGVTI